MTEQGIRDSSEEFPVEFSTPPTPFSLAAQFLAIAGDCNQAAKKKQQFNPRPKGSIQAGSATDVVLAFLQETHRFHTMAQIIWKTGRTHSAVSWALIRLREWGKVEAIEDPSRNARYFRYRARKESEK